MPIASIMAVLHHCVTSQAVMNRLSTVCETQEAEVINRPTKHLPHPQSVMPCVSLLALYSSQPKKLAAHRPFVWLGP